MHCGRTPDGRPSLVQSRGRPTRTTLILAVSRLIMLMRKQSSSAVIPSSFHPLVLWGLKRGEAAGITTLTTPRNGLSGATARIRDRRSPLPLSLESILCGLSEFGGCYGVITTLTTLRNGLSGATAKIRARRFPLPLSLESILCGLSDFLSFLCLGGNRCRSLGLNPGLLAYHLGRSVK